MPPRPPIYNENNNRLCGVYSGRGDGKEGVLCRADGYELSVSTKALSWLGTMGELRERKRGRRRRPEGFNPLSEETEEQ